MTINNVMLNEHKHLKYIEMELYHEYIQDSEFQLIISNKYLCDVENIIRHVFTSAYTVRDIINIYNKYNIDLFNKIHTNIDNSCVPKNCTPIKYNVVNELIMHSIIKIYHHIDLASKVKLSTQLYNDKEKILRNMQSKIINIKICCVYAFGMTIYIINVKKECNILIFDEYTYVLKNELVVQSFVDEHRNIFDKISLYKNIYND